MEELGGEQNWVAWCEILKESRKNYIFKKLNVLKLNSANDLVSKPQRNNLYFETNFSMLTWFVKMLRSP